jgi:hypothetical protein
VARSRHDLRAELVLPHDFAVCDEDWTSRVRELGRPPRADLEPRICRGLQVRGSFRVLRRETKRELHADARPPCSLAILPLTTLFRLLLKRVIPLRPLPKVTLSAMVSSRGRGRRGAMQAWPDRDCCRCLREPPRMLFRWRSFVTTNCIQLQAFEFRISRLSNFVTAVVWQSNENVHRRPSTPR